jgi:hypothetical protein
MNNRLSLLMFVAAISFLTLSCSQTTTSFLSQTSEPTEGNQSGELSKNQIAELKWLQYADPKADANLAIQKQDFTLLAFAGRVTSFPGIDNKLSTLSQQCGYRLLANSGDVLRSENELKFRKQLYQYSATYNQLVAAACQKKVTNTIRTSP